MKYYVDLSYYYTSSGYSHSETFDKGVCDKQFTAKEFWQGTDGLEVEEDGWITVDVSFYKDEDDPMFDKPIATSSCYVDSERIEEIESEKEGEN